MHPTPEQAPQLPPAPPPRPGYLELTSDLGISLVLVMPLLVLYQLGLMLIDFQFLNAVDFVTRFVYTHHGLKGMVLVNLCVVAAAEGATMDFERKRAGSTIKPRLKDRGLKTAGRCGGFSVTAVQIVRVRLSQIAPCRLFS